MLEVGTTLHDCIFSWLTMNPYLINGYEIIRKNDNRFDIVHKHDGIVDFRLIDSMNSIGLWWDVKDRLTKIRYVDQLILWIDFTDDKIIIEDFNNGKIELFASDPKFFEKLRLSLRYALLSSHKNKPRKVL